MIRAAALAAVLVVLGGCDVQRSTTGNAEIRPDPYPRMKILRDDQRGVTCWSMGDRTLSCLPDWMLTPQPDPQAVKP